MKTATTNVAWERLRPDDFRTRRETCPVVYLPLGLCEPHGHIAALGLDSIKATYYCEAAARRFGGIVAPTQGYHIHESGFHAPWLAEVVGDENPLMAALPPRVVLQLFLYQLRAFANTGFKAVIAVSGHGGGSQDDLRRVARAFTERTAIPVVVQTDAELVTGLHTGDHAGRFEISQLLAIDPDLVDLSLLRRQSEPKSGGRLALGSDAAKATAAHGRKINEAIIAALGRQVATLVKEVRGRAACPRLDYAAMETLWDELVTTADAWRSHSPASGQSPIPSTSQWHGYDWIRAPKNQSG